MLLAASPRKVSERPGRAPTCSWTVSRSASSWHGWNWSVSAFTTGTPAYAAISSMPLLTVGAPHDGPTTAGRAHERCPRSTRAPPRPQALPSTTIGKPPSSAIAGREGDLGARVGLSKRTATVCGPSSGRVGEAVLLQRLRRGRSTSACSAGVRSSSRRKCRMSGRLPRMPAPGSPARPGGSGRPAASVSTRGGASRIADGRAVVDDVAVPQGDAATSAATARRDRARSAAPGPGSRSRAGGPGRRPGAADVVRVARAGLLPRWCRARRRPRRRRPGCRRTSCRGCPGANRPAAGPTPIHAPIGMPPPSPLASVTMSGVTPDARVGEPGPGAADPGLHLVEPQQGPGLAGDVAGSGEEAVRRDDHTGLPLDRLEDDRGHRRVHRRAQGAHVAVRDEGDVAGQRLERLAVGGLRGERQRPERAPVERALHGDDARAPRAAG